MPKKILIVEDQVDSLNTLALFFQREGYNIITARDGQEGFDVALKEKPDLVLTDITMPNLDGIELIKLLRRTSQLKKVPIIAITSHKGKIPQAIAAGADEAVRKPVRYDLLLARVAVRLSIP